MTTRQLEALKRRLLAYVDDPVERQRLFLQAVHADGARQSEIDRKRVAKAQRGVDSIKRRMQRFKFLFEGVALLMPEIPEPEKVPMGELIKLVQVAHPELAEQLRAYLESR